MYCVRGLCFLNSFTIYQMYIDKTLTKRTSKAIQKRISDLLLEKTGDQVRLKKPCFLKESQQNDKINQSSENSEYYDCDTIKRNKILYS